MYRFKNFKCFADVSLDLDRAKLTVLIGRNGSGKSNAIEALALLGALAHGLALTEIGDVKETARHRVRGGLAGCFRKGAREIELGFADSTCEYTLRLQAGPAESAYVAAEKLEAGHQVPVFEVAGSHDSARGTFDVRIDNFKRGPNKPTVTVPATRSVLSQYTALATPIVATAKISEATDLVQAMLRRLGNVRVFDPHPAAMRGYVRQSDDRIEADGSNLAAVLYRLRNGTPADQQVLERILGCIARLPEEAYEDWVFDPTKFGAVAFALRQQGGQVVEANLLSDGTLRALAILAAVATAEADDVIVVEELDNGIHPSRTKDLLDFCWEVAHERSVKVLVTTHNATTLSGLSAEQLRGVVLCWWDEASGSSQLKHLTDLPDPGPFLSPGHLGDDVTYDRLRSRLVPESDYQALRNQGLTATFARLRELSSWREAK